MKLPRVFVRASALLLVLLSSACTVHMQQTPIAGPDAHGNGTIHAADRVSGMTGGRVGWGRLSLLAIPVAPIHVEGDDAAVLMGRVHDALRKAGFAVVVVPATAPAGNQPVLQCAVTKFRFSNYTWLAPLVPTWGRISLEVSLKDPHGGALWSRHFEARGSTLNFTDGYSISANEAMDKILAEMVLAFSEPAFAAAIGADDQPVPESAGR